MPECQNADLSRNRRDARKTTPATVAGTCNQNIKQQQQRQQEHHRRQQQKGDKIQHRCQKQQRLANNSNNISRDTNSTIWIPTPHVFRGNLPKSLQNSKKFVKKDAKKQQKSPIFCPLNFSPIAIRLLEVQCCSPIVEVPQKCQSDIPIVVTQSISYMSIRILSEAPPLHICKYRPQSKASRTSNSSSKGEGGSQVLLIRAIIALIVIF